MQAGKQIPIRICFKVTSIQLHIDRISADLSRKLSYSVALGVKVVKKLAVLSYYSMTLHLLALLQVPRRRVPAP